MNEIALRDVDTSGFKKAFNHCKKWSADQQAEVGLAEMALGVAIIALGVQTGAIQLGTDIVGSTFSVGELTGAGAGATIGGIGASILGSIGVVAGGFAIGIPAVVLAGGGMSILGAAGYAVGDIAEKLLMPPSGLADLLTGASLSVVGIVLIVDGARRVVTDSRVLKAASNFKKNVIHLAPLATSVVAITKEELEIIITDLSNNSTASITSGATAAAGAMLGGGLAASSVTFLGSHALGAAALSLGLVSAPVWPIIAGGAAGLALGVAAWKGIKKYHCK